MIRLDRRPKRFFAVATLGVLLLVTGFSIVDLWAIRNRALAQAEARAANLSTVLSEYIREIFAAGDASLRQLAVHSTSARDLAATDWSPILLAARSALTGIGSLSITDTEGTIVSSSQPAIVGQSRRDDYVFQHLRALTSDQLVVGPPFLAPAPRPRLLIPFGRRLLDEQGRFAGTVVATAIPEENRALFRTVNVGSQGTVWVFHPNGVVLFREPSTTNPIGESAQGNPLFQAAQAEAASGTLHGRLEPAGPGFISAFHRIGTPPVIVAVSLQRDEVLSDWYHERNVTSAALAVLGLTLAMTVFVLFRQMDARAQAATSLRETNERLAAALASEQRARQETEAASYVKDEFLMTVSHELRTPLTAIYGWARLLATGQVRGDQRTRALATIERNARAQTRLIDDLLDVSRVISGKLRLDVRPVHLDELVRGAIEAMRPALAARAIRLETSIAPDVPAVAGDPERLQQIVWNLLSNATKFTPEGGQVRLGLSQVGSRVEIAVTDSGVGIEPEFLPYVFDRFRQQEGGARRRYGGLGLGLAIVRHLVELHGGSVTAESEGEGRGATFTVALPIQTDVVPADLPEPQPMAPPPVTGARLDGLKILVVDDEAEARELFTSILEHAGATVMTASSAEEAMSLLEYGAHDVLMSDIEMAGQDGYQLATRALARSRERGGRLNAIAVTAYARPEDRIRALEHGFHWHLAKPIEPSELVSVIASLANTPAAESRPN